MRKKIYVFLILLVSIAIVYGIVLSEKEGNALSRFKFKLGLDLRGGTELIYKADTSKTSPESLKESLASLRDVVERRVNTFGVAEPYVAEETVATTGGVEHRIVVELPGVTDTAEAARRLGDTPTLEFKTVSTQVNSSAIQINNGKAEIKADPTFASTGLTGAFLKKSTVEFDQNTASPHIAIQFNDEGAKLFEKITEENIGKPIAIFLDGEIISAPNVEQKIVGGRAVITGKFTIAEAKVTVQRLNSGALPVPISLVSVQTIGSSLGSDAVQKGVTSGIIGFLLIAAFLILWYRASGFIAAVVLVIYAALTLALFKLFGVVLTAAGIAGFIISLGIAVDANILIFERFREEREKDVSLRTAFSIAFDRAWSSIRDSNISTLITAFILFWFGSSLIRGFGLTLMIGVLVSMVTAYGVSRLFLEVSLPARSSAKSRFLFGSGLSK